MLPIVLTVLTVALVSFSMVFSLKQKKKSKQDLDALKKHLEKAADVVGLYETERKVIYMEVNFHDSDIDSRTGISKRDTRLSRANWWINQMRTVISSVWTPKPTRRAKLPCPNSNQGRDSLHQIVTFWGFFQYILPPKTRREAFEPAYNDIKSDYLISLQYRSKWVRRWFCFCFICRTFFMVGECFWVAGGGKLKKLVLVFIPEAVRKFFIG